MQYTNARNSPPTVAWPWRGQRLQFQDDVIAVVEALAAFAARPPVGPGDDGPPPWRRFCGNKSVIFWGGSECSQLSISYSLLFRWFFIIFFASGLLSPFHTHIKSNNFSVFRFFPPNGVQIDNIRGTFKYLNRSQSQCLILFRTLIKAPRPCSLFGGVTVVIPRDDRATVVGLWYQ